MSALFCCCRFVAEPLSFAQKWCVIVIGVACKDGFSALFLTVLWYCGFLPLLLSLRPYALPKRAHVELALLGHVILLLLAVCVLSVPLRELARLWSWLLFLQMLMLWRLSGVAPTHALSVFEVFWLIGFYSALLYMSIGAVVRALSSHLP